MSSTVKSATNLVTAPVRASFGDFSGLDPLLDPQAKQRAADQARQQGNINSANASLDQLLSYMRNGSATSDRNQLLTENAANKTERQSTLDNQNNARGAQLNSMATLLAKQNQDALGQAAPNILEDLNSRGLLRSSAVGNQFANTLGNLTANTNNQIAQQGLANEQAYTNGQGAITEADIAGKGSATQRQFSLGDYADQIQAGKLTGQATAPIQPFQGKVPSPVLGAAAGVGAGAAKGKAA